MSEAKYKHSTATHEGYGFTTIRGKVDLLIRVSGGKDVLHHALIVKAIQDANEALMEYGSEVHRCAVERFYPAPSDGAEAANHE